MSLMPAARTVSPFTVKASIGVAANGSPSLSLPALTAWSKRAPSSLPLGIAKRPVGGGRPTLDAANWAYHPAEATGSAAIHNHRDIGFSPPQPDEQTGLPTLFCRGVGRLLTREIARDVVGRHVYGALDLGGRTNCAGIGQGQRLAVVRKLMLP